MGGGVGGQQRDGGGRGAIVGGREVKSVRRKIGQAKNRIKKDRED